MNNQKLNTMITMQEAMNSKVHPEWREQNFNWLRAIWLEAAEAVEHTDWKWWKAGTINVDQVRMELVDIWHFILSANAQHGYTPVLYSRDSVIHLPIKEALENLALTALTESTTRLSAAFFICLYDIGMDFDELYRLYVGKNILNFFRQNNGYKTGTYIKIWNGKEDNEVLTGILNDLDTEADDYKDQVYAALEAVYATVVAVEVA
jgi:dimeric dUTPase (all-alpha-NTP-PPase superfamily)